MDSDKKIVAYVNKEPIYESELNREIALKARRDPMFKVTPETLSEELENIVNRKLIIQQAMEKGLAREDRFINTIKSFWEQTLIRDFVGYKRKDFQDYLFATEDEIKNYYDSMPGKEDLGPIDDARPEIEKRIIESKENKLFEDWLESERKKAKVEIVKKQGNL
jgi:hypothetical protein